MFLIIDDVIDMKNRKCVYIYIIAFHKADVFIPCNIYYGVHIYICPYRYEMNCQTGL